MCIAWSGQSEAGRARPGTGVPVTQGGETQERVCRGVLGVQRNGALEHRY